MGPGRKHWFRAKFGNGRYRLFYQFRSQAKVIIYGWVNDGRSLRTYGARTDAYAVFGAMLDRGELPDRWSDLMRAIDPGTRPAAPVPSRQAKGKKGRKR